MNNNLKMPSLRICVTEKCLYKCIYCRAGGEASEICRDKELKVSEIANMIKLLVKCGISHIKITGGDPFIRNDIIDVLDAINTIPGIMEVQLITMSPRAGDLASVLKNNGISALNFSIDSLDPDTFSRISHGELAPLLSAITKAHAVGLKLKFNMVVMKGINDKEIQDMITFTGQYGGTLKLLDLMEINGNQAFFEKHYYPFNDLLDMLAAKCDNQEVSMQAGELGTPMPSFRMPNGATVLVKDSRIGTWYSHTCVDCRNFPCQDAIMALRLTASGKLQRCIYRDDNLVDLRSMMYKEKEEIICAAIETVLATYTEAEYCSHAWEPIFMRMLKENI